jgi:hypothetical protein
MSSQTYCAPRPASFHAGTMPEHVFLRPAAPVYADRRQPQPLFVDTAYGQHAYPPPHAAYLPAPLPGSPQRQSAYHFAQAAFPGYFPPPPPPPPQQQQQQQQPQWPVDPYRARRMSQQAPLPVVDYPPMPPGYTTMPYLQQLTRRFSVARVDPSHVASPDEATFFGDHDEDFYRMPLPPPKPTQAPARPAMRHAHTTSAVHPPTFHPRAERETVVKSYEISPRKQSFEGRRQSLHGGRPPPRPIAQGRPSDHSVRMNRAGPSHEQAGPPMPQRQRPRPPSYYSQDASELERQVEEYQTAKGGGPASLTTDAISQVVRRRSKVEASSASETGSRAGSSRDGSDSKQLKSASRTSVDRHRPNGTEVKSRKGDAAEERFTMRIQTGQGPGVTVGFKGDAMDRKTISLRPSRDGGQMELSIGDRAARTRDGRVHEPSVKRYASASSRRPVREIGEREYADRGQRSRSVMDRDGETGSAEQRTEGNDAVVAEKGLIKKLRNLRVAEGRSRRPSRNGRVVVEGQPF